MRPSTSAGLPSGVLASKYRRVGKPATILNSAPIVHRLEAAGAVDYKVSLPVQQSSWQDSSSIMQITATSTDPDAARRTVSLVNHTLEGTYGAPEYGGNAKLVGWTTTRYDGDSAPLGHSAYDASIDAYVDRADQPTSSATPGAATETFDTDVLNTLTVAAIGSGGMRFS